MRIYRMIVIGFTGMFFCLILTGCHGDISVAKERPVAKVGASKVYDISLEREVLRSMQIIRNNKRNDFYGFSPLRSLKIIRGNLAYLIQETALVLPAGTLDKGEISRNADKLAEETAQEVYNLLMDGKSWDEVNEEYSSFENKDNGGELPPFPRGHAGLPEGFYDLNPGDILPPFKWSWWGHTIMRFDGVSEGDDRKEQFHASIILILPD